MIGILLITHNGLGDSLVDCVRHVMGSLPPKLRVLSVLGGDDPQQKESAGRELLAELDTGEGVLILSDLFGATPCNIGMRLSQPGRVVTVSGVNLPMLLRVISYSNKSLNDVANKAVEGGRDCIILADSEKGSYAKPRCADY
ncbi:MAG: PTS sugar transporter subunit IIA [Candidatus Nitrotoga sp.]|nr:PTS sugar transporter subunit IIA [Candidatus Nitrotoga sp.]MBP0116688.1 PTS sugar transporter subunit IIA [Candidatus Nitrotoga sp.]MBP0123086.1 PTS sugar transporter subunit IIA [Candidatus Nitrotoga sp.]MBP0126291.1 PTS sugar transporter subunit IIA [Candidatus Nitrotoga sp.]